jgi:hypothetical protein
VADARKTEDKPKPGSKGYEVRTPWAGFNGVRAGVRFTAGVGHAATPEQAEACAALGYQVTDLAAPATPTQSPAKK